MKNFIFAFLVVCTLVVSISASESVITPDNMSKYDLDVEVVFRPEIINKGSDSEFPSGMVIIHVLFDDESHVLKEYTGAYLSITDKFYMPIVAGRSPATETVSSVFFVLHESLIPEVIVVLEQTVESDRSDFIIDIGAFWKKERPLLNTPAPQRSSYVRSVSKRVEGEGIPVDVMREIEKLLYGIGTEPDYARALDILSAFRETSGKVNGSDLAAIIKPKIQNTDQDSLQNSMMSNLIKLAWEGNINAQYTMGMIHYYGIGVRRDHYAASKWFVKAAKGGHPDGVVMAEKSGAYRQRVERKDLMTEAYKKYRERNYKDSVELYKKAYEQDVGISHGGLAAMWVGSLHEQGGHGIEKNLDTAVEWYSKAVEKGHDFALGDLGELYSSSRNPSHYDKEKAVNYAEKQLQAMPLNFLAHRDSAKIYAQLGDYERAVELQQKAVFLGKRRGVESDKSMERAERVLKQYIRKAQE